MKEPSFPFEFFCFDVLPPPPTCTGTCLALFLFPTSGCPSPCFFSLTQILFQGPSFLFCTFSWPPPAKQTSIPPVCDLFFRIRIGSFVFVNSPPLLLVLELFQVELRPPLYVTFCRSSISLFPDPFVLVILTTACRRETFSLSPPSKPVNQSFSFSIFNSPA